MLRAAPIVACCALLLLPVGAAADIYRYVDANGVQHYTNVQPKGKGWQRIYQNRAAAQRLKFIPRQAVYFDVFLVHRIHDPKVIAFNGRVWILKSGRFMHARKPRAQLRVETNALHRVEGFSIGASGHRQMAAPHLIRSWIAGQRRASVG